MDQHARELIQNDLDTTYLVEAGAGTGKTTLLVSRILNLIRSGRAALPQIVAITFTEKAAEELKTRIKKQLQLQLDTEKSANVLQRIRSAYLDIEKSNINTIHGFCASILKQYAIEAGLSPEFSVADPGAFHKFIQQLWQRWLIEQIEEQNKCLYSLLLLGISFEKLEKIVQLLIHQRDMRNIDKVDVDLEYFQQQLAKITDDLQAQQQHCTDQQDKGYIAIEALKDKHAFLRQQPLEQFAYYVAHGIEIKSGGNQKNWEPPQILKEIKQQLKNLKILSETTRAHHNHNLVCDTISWLSAFFTTVEQKKQTQALVDFDDLLYRVKHLLQTHNEIRRQCQENFRYILVDEFQDTNDLQVEILFQLASADEELRDWQQAQLIPGKLFMVGDPKQSIYRFRGADIEIYETVKEILGAEHCLFITRNFRSTHGIIHWCNQVFSRLIVKPEDGKYQPQYTALAPSREGAQIVNPIILISYDLEDERAIEQEAKCVAESVRQVIDEKWTVFKDGREQTVSYQDIAILFRRYTYVDLFEQVLSSSNIPYQVIGGKSSFNRIEVHSLLSLLRALINPNDTMSLIAALRSPIFCISDREILHYSQQGLDYLSKPQTDTRIAQVMRLLREFHLQLTAQTGYQWLQNLYQKTHILLTFASMQQGKQYVKTLQKILNFAKVMTLNNFMDWQNFIHWLSELDSLDNESQVEEDAVSIFSIHRSKGLEFPVVILADVAANIRELPYIIHDKPTDSIAVRLQRGLLETQNYSAICDREKNRLVAEEKRLLYVAATRARDYLLIPVSGKKQGFLHFLHEDISAADTNIHVDTFHSIVKDVTLTSMEPVKIKNFDPVSESQWFSHRQRFLSQQQKSSVTHRQNIHLEHYKGQQIANEIRDLLCMIFANATRSFLQEQLKNFYTVKFFHAEKILSHLQNIDERIKLSKKRYHNLPFAFSFENYFVMGNIDIAFQENDGFVMIDCNLARKHDDNHYLYLGTIYAFAVSQLLNCMLKEITFYFVEENSSYRLTNFDFERMDEILDYMAETYSS